MLFDYVLACSFWNNIFFEKRKPMLIKSIKNKQDKMGVYYSFFLLSFLMWGIYRFWTWYSQVYVLLQYLYHHILLCPHTSESLMLLHRLVFLFFRSLLLHHLYMWCFGGCRCWRLHLQRFSGYSHMLGNHSCCRGHQLVSSYMWLCLYNLWEVLCTCYFNSVLM